MGRSKTIPVSESRLSESSKTPINRSATAAPQSTPHHIKVPFRHRDAKQNVPVQMTTATATSTRPGVPRRQNSVQTRYMNMLLAMDTIPRFHNILISFFTWILLAGFVIFPGTFTSIAQLDENPNVQESDTASAIVRSFKNVPLIVVAAVCCGIGAGGMLWLWWTWRQNYVWLLNRIFLPGCLNSFAGLISTLINVYSQQDGNWSITAKVTAIVTGSCMVILAVLFALYNFWVLEKVRKSHGREMERDTMAHEDETIGEKVERVVHEPALEPGSVV